MTTDPDQGSPKKRQFRVVFGLRTLLILVLVIGGGLGWIVYAARVQREAVATVLRLGGQCRYDWESQNRQPAPIAIPGWRKWLIKTLGPDYVGSVTQVDLGFPPSIIKPSLADLASLGRLTRLEHLSLTDLASAPQGLAQIRNLSRLKHLDLFETGRTGAGDLAPLANFTELEELQLSLSWMSDANLAHLAGLTRLKYLTLSTPNSRVPSANPSITDAGLVALESLHNLISLQIMGENKITNAGLTHLSGLTRLQILSIQGKRLTSLEPLRPLVGLKLLNVGGTGTQDPGIDDAGAAPLADLLQLESVHLAGNKSFTNAGLAHLRALPNLVSLQVSGTAVDDAGVASLVDFPQLSSVFLAATSVTDVGLAALAKRPGYATIDVSYTKVTPEGAAAARLALPGTTILEGSVGGFTINYTPISYTPAP